MNLKKYIASLDILRKIFFPVLRRLDLRIIIPHPFTIRPFYLKFWSHKGYWYYAKNREEKEIHLLKRLISKGDNVLEIGAHIGFITQICENLVSKDGKVIAIEPSPFNFKLLKLNTKKETKTYQLALSDESKKGNLYIDNFGGFTNSIKKANAESRTKFFSKKQKFKIEPLSQIEINIETIDSICKINNFIPTFIKIDVEGAEYEVLKGALNTLPLVTNIMIEVRKDKIKIFNLLESKDFVPINKEGIEISYSNLKEIKEGNNFFFIRK